MATCTLSIVIPTYQRGDLLRACLESVTRHAPEQTEILVVDDASPNHAASNAIADFPMVRLIRREKRGGFAATANTGICEARGDIIELLNDDTEVQAGWAEKAIRHFEDETVGAVAPLVLSWPNGDCIDSAGDRYYLGGVAAKRGHGATTPPAQAQNVFGASASSAFYRRSALARVGLFPESFGSYFEDLDLAFRLQRAGYRAVFEPSSRVLHHAGASHGPPRRALVQQQSLNEERVFWRNLPPTQLGRAVPRHVAVLMAKAWRRWQEGLFWPFFWGRMKTLAEIPAIVRHRRELQRLGPGDDFHRWGVESQWWGLNQRA